MTSLKEATERLERAIAQLERAASQLAVGGAKTEQPQLPLGAVARTDDTQLAVTAAHVAARLDAAIGRLDRLLEE